MRFVIMGKSKYKLTLGNEHHSTNLNIDFKNVPERKKDMSCYNMVFI